MHKDVTLVECFFFPSHEVLFSLGDDYENCCILACDAV